MPLGGKPLKLKSAYFGPELARLGGMLAWLDPPLSLRHLSSTISSLADLVNVPGLRGSINGR